MEAFRIIFGSNSPLVVVVLTLPLDKVFQGNVRDASIAGDVDERLFGKDFCGGQCPVFGNKP